MTWAKELNLTKKQALKLLAKNVKINKWAFNQIGKCKLCELNKGFGAGVCLEHINEEAVTEEKKAIAFKNIIKIAQKRVKK